MRTYGGTSIGLSISKCLVHLKRGIGRMPHMGSTFTFTAVFARLNDSLSHQAGDLSEFGGMRALLVDPNPVWAMVSKYHIERLGILVEVATDLDQTFSDLSMVFVEEDVWEKDLEALSLFLENLRELDCGVILLSNSTRSNGCGFSNYPFVVTKPLRASMLVACLQRAVGGGGGGNDCSGEVGMLCLSNVLGGRKILVVDDNSVNLRVAAGVMKKYGADVFHAQRGKEVIALLTLNHSFDACFMDIQMPKMDGFEATRRIREIEWSINKGIERGEVHVEA